MQYNNSVIFLNENNEIYAKEISLKISDDAIFYKVIPHENSIIVGVFLDGIFQDPRNKDLRVSIFPLTDIEKYLMVNTNIQFVVPSTQFRTASLPIEWGVKNGGAEIIK